jgi:hypothetical protein
MAGEGSFLCSICFQSVSLEDCKIDEDGRPVHENCHEAKVLYAESSGKNPRDPQVRHGLVWRIMSFRPYRRRTKFFKRKLEQASP